MLFLSRLGPALKKAWQSILQEWKMTSKGRKHAILPKVSFSILLKSLVTKLNYGNGAGNVISGL